MPSINENRCTACGFCVSKCPSDAININILKVKNETSKKNTPIGNSK